MLKIFKNIQRNRTLSRLIKDKDVTIERYFKDLYYLSIGDEQIIIIPYFYFEKYSYVLGLLKSVHDNPFINKFEVIISDNPKAIRNMDLNDNTFLYDDLTSNEYINFYINNSDVDSGVQVYPKKRRFEFQEDYKLNYVSTKVRLVQYAVHFKAKSIMTIDLDESKDHKDMDKEYLDYMKGLGVIV